MSNPTRRKFLVSAAGIVVGTACTDEVNRSGKTAAGQFARDRFLDDVRNALPAGQEAVDEVLAHAVSDPDSVIRDLGSPVGRAADLLYRDDTLTVFNIVLPPQSTVAPHDHRMWASIGVYAGSEDNALWRPAAGDSITRIDTLTVATGEVFPLPQDAIHSMTNPGAKMTAAIHVYGGDLYQAEGSRWDAATGQRVAFATDRGEPGRRHSAGSPAREPRDSLAGQPLLT